METSNEIDKLVGALAKAQSKITGALKDSANPFFKSKYADLASCWDACRGPLSENGIAIIQGASADDTGVTVTTTLAHESGQWMRSNLRMVPKDSSPQGIGSAVTYGRRYGLTSMVGIAQIDDDGNQASGKGSHAYAEPITPHGDAIKNVPVDKAREEATRMRAVLEMDLEERVLALRVLDMHEALNMKDQELYIAAADQMSSKERSAWKQYVAMGKKLQHEPLNGRAA